MDTTTPIAAVAMASVIIELKMRSRMMVTLSFAMLLERILFDADKIGGVVFCGRVGAFSLCKGEVFHARRVHQACETIISFDAARLVINPVLLIILPGELLFYGPGPRSHRRIFDGDLVFERRRA